MKGRGMLAWAWVALACIGRADAQVDLDALGERVAGERAQVLVLGSTHLSGMSGTLDPASLAPLLDRLRAFRPDVIAVEALPGETCDQLRRHPALYPGVAGDYCPETSDAQRATGLDVPAAIAQVHARLKDWPARPTPAQRRALAARFLAAGEPASALVQWLQLPPAERRPGDGLDAGLAARLQRLDATPNESYQLGARLAASLGHARVHPMDDHTADRIQDVAGPGLEATMQRIWSTPDASADTVCRREAALSDAGDMLALYRYHNGDEYLHAAIDTDFGAALRDDTPERYGRRYVGWWEARNLRMAANIREAFANRPGARVLVIVGSSHKPYLDDYLRRMHGVDTVDAAGVLR